MNGAEAIVPVTLFISSAAMIVGVAYLRSRENLAMIEKNMNPKDKKNRPAPFWSLKWGLLLMGAGLGMFIAYIIDTFAIQSIRGHENIPALYFSLIGLGGGLGLVLSFFIEKKHWLDKED